MMAWLRTRALPWVVWAGALIGAGALWFDVRHESAVGFALGTEYLVAPHVAGRIETLQVSPGQRVRAGQIVATLGAEAIDAELAILAAERERLTAELGAVRSDSQVRNFDTTREFDESVASAELALRTARADRNVRAAEYKALSAQTEVLKNLVDQRMADRRELDALMVQHTTLSEELQTAEAQIKQLASQASAARARRSLLPTDAATQAVRPLQAELAVLAGQEQLLAARRGEIVLRAPGRRRGRRDPPAPRRGRRRRRPDRHDRRRHRQRGARVPARVAGRPRRRRRARAAEPRASAAAPACPAASPASARGSPSSRSAAGVTPSCPSGAARPTSASPSPPRCCPARRSRSRSPATSPPSPPRRRPPTRADPRAQPTTDDPPRPITDPARAGRPHPPRAVRARVVERAPALHRRQRRHRPRRARRARPLAVHDGRARRPRPRAADRRRPRVLQRPRVDRGWPRGQLLPARLAEPQPQGQAPRGPPGVRARHDRRAGARADAVIRLAERLDEGGPALLATLGLTDTTALDLEGMTATSRGGLLLGLKEPLDERGEAVIWHLPQPDAAAGRRQRARCRPAAVRRGPAARQRRRQGRGRRRLRSARAARRLAPDRDHQVRRGTDDPGRRRVARRRRASRRPAGSAASPASSPRAWPCAPTVPPSSSCSTPATPRRPGRSSRGPSPDPPRRAADRRLLQGADGHRPAIAVDLARDAGRRHPQRARRAPRRARPRRPADVRSGLRARPAPQPRTSPSPRPRSTSPRPRSARPSSSRTRPCA
jgi:hypothetical protein